VLVLYLSGCKNSVIAEDLADGTIGLLNTPASRYSLNAVSVWAMDNGAFTGKYPGDDKYLTLLTGYMEHQDRCLFVAAPDVIGDAGATLSRFTEPSRILREAGWPVALVGQDGMEGMPVPWESVDYLFVGGSTEWKLGEGVRSLIRDAQRWETPVHVGRVNSRKRYRYFRDLGCDTADGTYIAFGPSINAPKVRSWMRES